MTEYLNNARKKMQYTQDSHNSLIVKHLRRAGLPKSLEPKDLGRLVQLIPVDYSRVVNVVLNQLKVLISGAIHPVVEKLGLLHDPIGGIGSRKK
jgi:hypothetical protein